MSFPLDSLIDVIRDLTTSGSGSGAMRTNIAQSSFTTGAKSAITTVSTQITTSSVGAQRGVLVKAAVGNSQNVYVGKSTVTNGSTDATDGFELSAGESVFIEANNANVVYVVATSGSQKVFWVAT